MSFFLFIFLYNLLWMIAAAAAAAKWLQSCPTQCDPIDGSPPGAAVHGIFQARVLELVFLDYKPLPISNICLLVEQLIRI